MITIPATNLTVYPLCLGGNVFGWSASKEQSFEILNHFFDHGGNFIDTADVYSEWADGNTGGESETIIGEWIQARKNRQDIVIGTKVAKLSTRRGLSKSNILKACDDSLQRLKTDYIDIYYSHEDDPTVPFEETLSAYDELIQAGKVRYIAASQHSAARLESALDAAEQSNLPKYIALQDHYNLVHREPFESEQAKVLVKHGISMIPFFGLATGFLTGKYQPGIAVDSVRAKSVEKYQNPAGWAVLEELMAVAKELETSVSTAALAWLRHHPQVSAPIASARTVAQLIEIMPLVTLSDDQITRLNSVSSSS
ncbi:MAG: aldo/keto reductase [Candidatus Nanopelagicales bacterium]